jgi:predicted Zn-dependent protease
MAQQFAEAIIAEGYIGAPQNANLPDSLWIHKIGVTEVDSEVAEICIRYLKSGWPFTNKVPPSQAEFRLENASYLQNLALQFWRDEITWEKLHVEAASFYTQTSQLEKAEAEYRALIHATPMNVSPYIFLGRLLYQQQKLDEALDVLSDAAKIEENALVFKMIGMIYLSRANPAGIQYLEKAAQAEPGDIETLYLLAQGYVMAKNFARADAAIQKVLRQKTDFPEAQKLAAYISQKNKVE